MTRASIIQTNFTSGELSPRLMARVDIAKYQNGCELLENWLLMPHGGVAKRPGFRFINATKTTNATRLIPFKFSTVQAYVIEFGASYFRFYKDGGVILSSGTPYEVAHPYTQDQLPNVKWVQSADVLFLFHPSVKPKKLSRTGHTNWTLTDYDFKDGPYLDVNPDKNKLLTPSAVTGSFTITASGTGNTPFASTDVGRHVRLRQIPRAWAATTAYVRDDIVKVVSGSSTLYYQCKTAGTSGAAAPTATSGDITDGTVVWNYTTSSDYWWRYAVITAFTSSTVVTATVTDQPLINTTATYEWSLGAWSDTTGWPGLACFFEERLWLAGTTNQPQTLWATRSGDFNNFAPTDPVGKVLDDSGLNYTISTDDVNFIRWLVPSKVLTILTDSGEFTMSASSLNEAITPTNVKVGRETARGVSNVRPVLVDKNLLFWQRAQRKLREYFYDFNVDGFRSNDATILSEHISLGGIVDMDYQQEPHSITWCVRADGQLIGFTYNKEQDVLGWHRHVLGGVNTQVKSVASIPATNHDELWVIVTRTIDGGTKQYIERLDPDFYPSSPDDKSGAFFVDSGLSYSGSPITLVSGLDHLKGETVQILANGAVRSEAVVNASGQITLARAASTIHVGLKYTSKLRSIRYEAGGNEGTSQTKTGRIQRLGLRLLNSLGVKFGPSESNMMDIQFRMGSDRMDQSPPLFTGDQVVNFPGDYDRSRQVVVISDQPYPCTLVGLIPWMVVYE